MSSTNSTASSAFLALGIMLDKKMPLSEVFDSNVHFYTCARSNFPLST